MREKKDLLPIGIATAIAIVVTVVVRLMFPYASGEDANNKGKKNLSVPEIPVVITKKGQLAQESLVLVVSRPIKKNQKITLASLEWKRWPTSALQPNFIAKDSEGRTLNNAADHTSYNGSTWAKSDIQEGLPFLASMCSPEDPVKKAEEEKKKAEEKRRKDLEKEKAESFIKRGMRAVTFPIDQRLASTSNMFSPGELVDVLIIKNGMEAKTYKYKAVKILAIDGVTKFEGARSNGVRQPSGLLGTIQTSVVGSLPIPKNVTLEIREELVDTMLKQAGDRGVILSLRNQKEALEDEDNICEYVGDGSGDGPFNAKARNRILKSIMEINRTSSAAILQADKAHKSAEENNIASIISNMNALANNARASRADLIFAPKSMALKNNTSGRYEVVRGKITNKRAAEEESDEDDTKKINKTITIYKKLNSNAIQFNKSGEIIDNRGSGSYGMGASTEMIPDRK